MAKNTLSTVAVIGAGDMGHGIAEVALLSGFRVNLQDINDGALEKGTKRIFSSLGRLQEKGAVSAAKAKGIRDELFRSGTDVAWAVKDADLVIEAVPEIVDVKKELFRKIDASAPEHAIIASNTSTMRISDFARETQRPDRVLGLHFFNPVILMRLVEVIRCEDTSEDTMRAGLFFCHMIGKTAVRVEKDVPGFIVNRVQAPSGILLFSMVDSGVATPEEVDATVRKIGMPMGPFEVTDYTGVDVTWHACRYYADTVHRDFSPGRCVEEKIRSGFLGKKSGRGFFDWSNGRPSIDLSRTNDEVDLGDLIAVQINEATKLVEMGACGLGDIDRAIVNGTGNMFGLLAMARGMQPPDLAKRLEGLSEKYRKEIFRPTESVRKGTYL